MSAEVLTIIFVIISFGGYIWIGYMSRVKDTKGFYVAGQGVPAFANGAATAADWMSAAAFIGLAGIISFLGFDGAMYLMGWTGGYVLLTLLLAPYLRKFGKYTVPDFVGDRYYSGTARGVAAVAAIVISFVYVAGQMRGVGIVFSRFLGVDVVVGVIIGMVIVSFFAVIGGMKGITWTQVAQYFVLIIAYTIPAIAISILLTGNPIPQLALTTSDIVPRLNQLQLDLGFTEYTQPFQSKPILDVLAVTMALMMGTAGLPHVIVRFYTVGSVSAARYSGFWALIFIGILFTSAPVIAVFAKYNLIQSLHGRTSAQIDELSWARNWEATGLLTFDDKDGNGRFDLKPTAEATEITIDRDMIVLSTPEVAQLSPVIIALVASGGLAAALSTASGLLLVISSSVSHDIYYRLINPNASEANRLLFGRGVILVAVIFAGLLGIYPPAFVAQVVAFAFGLGAASFFPVILLGIFDKRTNSTGAIAGMLTGLIFTLFYIIGNKYLGMPTWFLGISPEGIGSVGAMMNFGVTLIVSRLTKEPPQEIQDLVESVRVPRGAMEASMTH